MPIETITTTTTTTSKSLVLLTSTSETVYGIWTTMAGGNSTTATSGLSIGNYPTTEQPTMALDDFNNTKYTSFGPCILGNYNMPQCGLNTGFYFTPKRGSSLIVSLQICTANDYTERDPMTVTLEGSNQQAASLTLGSSWILIYNGSSGLNINPGRGVCGESQNIVNTVSYTSYRLLLTSKRGIHDSIQYSEILLKGY